MGIIAKSSLSTVCNSHEAGQLLAREVQRGMGEQKMSLCVVYATVTHDQQALLQGIRQMVGDVPIIGCSSQGVMARGATAEDGFLVGMMGLGGDSLIASVAQEEGIAHDTRAKGAALGRSLLKGLAQAPKAVVLHYDPLCGANMDHFLAGLEAEVRCPIIGGGAGQPFGRMVQTFQYFRDRVMSNGAVAAALAGDFVLESEICHGTTPVGIEMAVTQIDGTHLLALDGRPALAVWKEIAGAGPPRNDHTSALAVGLPFEDAGQRKYLVRAAFGEDAERGGVVLQTSLPPGSKVMLHHRTIEGVLGGTAEMAQALRRRIDPRRVRAVLGFECGARTEPFLGREGTLKENVDLQEVVAPDAAWLGMFAWGELYPAGGEPAFHNYSYPVLVIADPG